MKMVTVKHTNKYKEAHRTIDTAVQGVRRRRSTNTKTPIIRRTMQSNVGVKPSFLLFACIFCTPAGFFEQRVT